MTRFLPLYEAKMIHHFDHQWATYERDGTVRDVTPEEKSDPAFHVMPRYWVDEAAVDAQLDPRSSPVLGWRRNARCTDARTFIATPLTRVAVGDSIFIATSEQSLWPAVAILMSTFAFDFVVRQKLGGLNMSFYLVQQFPIPSPTAMIGCPHYGQPGEIDAWAFHLYGLSREDIGHVLATFPIVRCHDEAAHGEYRTRRLILDVFDRLADDRGASPPTAPMADRVVREGVGTS